MRNSLKQQLLSQRLEVTGQNSALKTGETEKTSLPGMKAVAGVSNQQEHLKDNQQIDGVSVYTYLALGGPGLGGSALSRVLPPGRGVGHGERVQGLQERYPTQQNNLLEMYLAYLGR